MQEETPWGGLEYWSIGAPEYWVLDCVTLLLLTAQIPANPLSLKPLLGRFFRNMRVRTPRTCRQPAPERGPRSFAAESKRHRNGRGSRIAAENFFQGRDLGHPVQAELLEILSQRVDQATLVAVELA